MKKNTNKIVFVINNFRVFATVNNLWSKYLSFKIWLFKSLIESNLSFFVFFLTLFIFFKILNLKDEVERSLCFVFPKDIFVEREIDLIDFLGIELIGANTFEDKISSIISFASFFLGPASPWPSLASSSV